MGSAGDFFFFFFGGGDGQIELTIGWFCFLSLLSYWRVFLHTFCFFTAQRPDQVPYNKTIEGVVGSYTYVPRKSDGKMLGKQSDGSPFLSIKRVSRQEFDRVCRLLGRPVYDCFVAYKKLLQNP